jgi:hypothetical protein
MLAEDIIADATKTFIQRTGLGSYGKVKIRTPTEAPSFGAFKWDITAPCYVSPLKQFSKKGIKAGFLVADIVLGVEVGIEHVKPFFAKAQAMRNQPNTPLFLALLIADRFTKEALQKGKNLGLLMLTTETLFTRDIAEALKELIVVLTNAAAAVTLYPDLVYGLFDRLSALEGCAASMRGPLLELWLARYLSLTGWHIDGIGKTLRVRATGDRAEVDVLVSQRDGLDIRACEAKAHSSPVSLSEAEDWVTRQIPRIRKALIENREGRQPKFSFEFWTSGSFSPEAKTFLETAASGAKNYEIKLFEGAQLSAFADESGDSYLPKLLNDFFLRNTTSARLADLQRRRSQLAHLESAEMPRPANPLTFQMDAAGVL